MDKELEKEKCEYCNGTGKVICNNPDHGFIESGCAGSDAARIGCPVCGHSEDHIVKCDDCKGTGLKPSEEGVDILEASIYSLLETYRIKSINLYSQFINSKIERPDIDVEKYDLKEYIIENLGKLYDRKLRQAIEREERKRIMEIAWGLSKIDKNGMRLVELNLLKSEIDKQTQRGRLNEY